MLSLLSLTACLIGIGISQAIEITNAPQNAVAVTGSSVQLTCEINEQYEGYFEWRVYIGSKTAGQQVYYSPPFTATDTRYHKFEEYGLEINPVEWRDAGKYSCAFLTGDVRATANIIVLDEPSAWSQPTALAVGQSANLSCTVSFGGPEMDATSPPDTQGMFPQLSLSLGPDRPLDLSTASLRHDPGQPGSKKHRLTVMTNHVVSMDDINRNLICTVSTSNPAFSTETTVELTVHAPAQDVRMEPLLNEYSVNDVINCSATGRPAPSIGWRWVSGGDGAAGASDGAVLTVTEEMVGKTNVWKCTAENSFGSDEMTITFNVTYAASGAGGIAESETGSGSMIGLAVGLTLLLVVILVVAGVIVFLHVRKRRQRDKSPHKKQNVPFVHVDANVGFRPNGGKQPIYQPRPSALNRGQVASTDDGADAPLDRSGYADLGLGIVRQASLEALDDNGGVDMRGRGAPRQDSVPKRAEGPFSDGWQDPNARHYTNVPVHSAEGDTDPVPFSPMGFADITGGLRGSRQSLDRAPDDRPGPGPTRGSNRSLNRSQDSATGAGAGANPRTRGRDAAAARGSNRSLNRSTDSSEAVPRRPPGAMAPHHGDPTRPPAHPEPPSVKPRPVMKPPLPPKKPEATAAASDDGTEV